MKSPLIFPAWLRAASVLVLMSLWFCLQARAAFVINMAPDGSGDIVATGSGTINLTALTDDGAFSERGKVAPSGGIVEIGPAAITSGESYTGITTMPSFGTGGQTNATSGSGNIVGIFQTGTELTVPTGYVSGALLSDFSEWSGQTLASLGLTPGTYTSTWGSGATADSLTLNISATVPEPASTALFGMGAAALLFRRRRNRLSPCSLGS